VLCTVLTAIGKADKCAELEAGLAALEKGEKPALPGGDSASRAPDLTLGGILGEAR